jgi:hypothetical protein
MFALPGALRAGLRRDMRKLADVAGADAIASQQVCRHRGGSSGNRHPSNGFNSCRSHTRSGNTPGRQKRRVMATILD